MKTKLILAVCLVFLSSWKPYDGLENKYRVVYSNGEVDTLTIMDDNPQLWREYPGQLIGSNNITYAFNVRSFSAVGIINHNKVELSKNQKCDLSFVWFIPTIVVAAFIIFHSIMTRGKKDSDI